LEKKRKNKCKKKRKNRKVDNKKKKNKKKREKLAKKKKEKTLWITVVIHSDLGVGGTVIPPHHLEYCTSYMTSAMPRVIFFHKKHKKN
jgi:hypothetical protein